MGVADHLTCLLRNLYGSQEATIRTAHGLIDWFEFGKDILQNIGPNVSQAGIKIAGKNINNLRYAIDTIQKPEREEELKSLFMRMK